MITCPSLTTADAVLFVVFVNLQPHSLASNSWQSVALEPPQEQPT